MPQPLQGNACASVGGWGFTCGGADEVGTAGRHKDGTAFRIQKKRRKIVLETWYSHVSI